MEQRKAHLIGGPADGQEIESPAAERIAVPIFGPAGLRHAYYLRRPDGGYAYAETSARPPCRDQSAE
jgi:hypothetical protein